MTKAKTIAMFLMVVFCAQTVVANKSISAYFSEGFKIVKPACQKHEKNPSKEKKGIATSSTKAFLVLTVNCQETFFPDNWNLQMTPLLSSTLDYNYFPKSKALVVLDRLLPPPKPLLV